MSFEIKVCMKTNKQIFGIKKSIKGITELHVIQCLDTGIDIHLIQ